MTQPHWPGWTLGSAGEWAVEQPPVSAESLAGFRLFVVDDSAASRELLVMLLEAHGAEVVAASSSREGLERVRERRPDMIVADIGLPDEDGYAFIRQVRAREAGGTNHIPALAFTAYATRDDRHRALAAGYRLHLPKGCDPRQVIGAIVSLKSPSQRRHEGRDDGRTPKNC